MAPTSNRPAPVVVGATGARPLTAGEQAVQRREARRAAMLNRFMSASPEARGIMPRANATTFGIPQYGPSFARTGLGALGGNIPGPVATAMGKVATQVGQASIDLWNAVRSEDTWLNSKWRNVMGSDTTFAAAKSAAESQSTLAREVDGRVRRILADDDLRAANDFLNEAQRARWADTATITQALDLISASGGAREIGTGIAKDAYDAASGAGKSVLGIGKAGLFILRNLHWILGGVAVLGVSYAGYRAWRLAKVADREFDAAAQAAIRNRLNPAGHTLPASPAVSGLSRRRRRRRRRS